MHRSSRYIYLVSRRKLRPHHPCKVPNTSADCASRVHDCVCAACLSILGLVPSKHGIVESRLMISFGPSCHLIIEPSWPSLRFVVDSITTMYSVLGPLAMRPLHPADRTRNSGVSSSTCGPIIHLPPAGPRRGSKTCRSWGQMPASTLTNTGSGHVSSSRACALSDMPIQGRLKFVSNQ